MPRQNYRLKLVRGGDEFEAEGDKAFVLSMLQRFQSMASAGKFSPAMSPSVTGQGLDTKEKPPPGKALAVGEFIRQLALRNHNDMVLAFGHYLERYSGVRDFTAADINRCYYDAKLDPSNTSQMIARNIRKGTMMEAKGAKASGKKRYMVTQTGDDKVRVWLSKVK